MRNLNIALMVAAALTLGLATAPVANAQGAGKTMTMRILATLLNPRSTSAALPGLPHFAPKAKRVIYLFMHGGPSQLDLFDHKPALAARRGEELPDSVRGTQRLTGMTSGQKNFPVTPTVFQFARHGASDRKSTRLNSSH